MSIIGEIQGFMEAGGTPLPANWFELLNQGTPDNWEDTEIDGYQETIDSWKERKVGGLQLRNTQALEYIYAALCELRNHPVVYSDSEVLKVVINCEFLAAFLMERLFDWDMSNSS